MLWLKLTQGDGQKIQINIGRADAYYTVSGNDVPKEMKGTNTVVDIGATAYYVQESVEQIDGAIVNSASLLRLIKGWGSAGNKT